MIRRFDFSIDFACGLQAYAQAPHRNHRPLNVCKANCAPLPVGGRQLGTLEVENSSCNPTTWATITQLLSWLLFTLIPRFGECAPMSWRVILSFGGSFATSVVIGNATRCVWRLFGVQRWATMWRRWTAVGDLFGLQELPAYLVVYHSTDNSWA